MFLGLGLSEQYNDKDHIKDEENLHSTTRLASMNNPREEQGVGESICAQQGCCLRVILSNHGGVPNCPICHTTTYSPQDFHLSHSSTALISCAYQNL